MPRIFSAKPLTSKEAARAFPLVQTLAPAVSLAEWTAFVAAVAGDGAAGAAGRLPMGITLMESEQGYIHGLFSYIVAPDVRHGRVLVVDNFIALDLVESKMAERALCAAMEKIAREHGCGVVHLYVPEPQAAEKAAGRPSLRIVERTGHRIEGWRLCKTFAPH